MDIIGGTDPRCLHHIDYPGVCSTVISGGKNSAITLGLVRGWQNIFTSPVSWEMQFLFPLSSWEPYGSERIRRAPKYTLLTTKGQNLGLLTSGSVSSHLCQTVCRSNSRSMCNQQPGWEEKVNKGIKGKQRRTRLRGDSESLRRARKSSWRSSAAITETPTLKSLNQTEVISSPRV